ncbi:MAG TPA: hypothetical protein VGK85_04215, partial [Myxococcaceae bacterium]
MTRSALAAVLLCAILAGCSSKSPSNNTLTSPPGIDRSPLLNQVTSCDQLQTAIADALVVEMESTLKQIQDSDYYIGVGG